MEKKRLQNDIYVKNEMRQKITIIIFVIIMFFMIIVSLLIGQYGFSIVDTIRYLVNHTVNADKTDTLIKIIINIRLPRTLSSVLIGGSLAVAGATYQCVFKNTLVSQDVLGVSTGACVGAAMAIVLNLSTYYIQFVSFFAGIITVILVLILSKIVKREKTLSMILSGVLIGGLMSSVLGYIKYIANPNTHLPEIVYWTMGNIASIDIYQIGYIVLPIIMCNLIIFTRRWNLNYFCYSDEEAKSLGVNISKERIIFVVCATILVSSAVSVAGSIGWIGLVVPNLSRLLVGSNNKKIIPASFFMGSCFLTLVDIINRIVSAAEVPISILTGIIGTPIFVCCLLTNSSKQKY